MTSIGDRCEAEPQGTSATPFSGEIARVTGRRAEGGRRGLPALDELALRGPDGRIMEFGTPDVGTEDTLTFLAEIQPRVFSASPDLSPTCPICVDAEATAREHVPQRNLGGQSMTLTCPPCNNGLGSKVEAPLQDWFDHALTGVAFEHDSEIRGRRHAPRMYFRRGENDAFALFIDGSVTGEVEQMLQSGKFTMNYREPHPRAYRLALLKHAYLAACLYLGHVPDTEEVGAIRADLIAARDTPRRGLLPESQAAGQLTVYRSNVGTQGPPLALVVQVLPGSTEPNVLISLAGVLFVSWPFAGSPAGTWQRTPGLAGDVR